MATWRRKSVISGGGASWRHGGKRGMAAYRNISVKAR